MRVVIVDDEPLARSRLVSLCEQQGDLEIVAEAGSGAAAIEAIRAYQPDVVLLDVELQDMSGFDVLKSVEGSDEPLAIMVTGHTQHAMRAFDSDVVHFLAKPVDGQRFGDAIVRARNRLSQERPSAPALAAAPPQQIAAERTHRLYFLEPESIDYIESEANYVAIHVGEERYLARNTLKHLTDVLAPLGFVRIERSLLLNLRRVAFAERLERGSFAFILRSGRRLVSSVTYRKGILNEIRYSRKRKSSSRMAR
jgi:two-component system LytT family response regulator